jgi:hypothetical protein
MSDDDVLRRLGAALRGVDDPEVDAILARAREAAVTEASAVLEALMTRSILERAVDHLTGGAPDEPPTAPEPEPAPEPDPGRLWYAYGIQRADAGPLAAPAGIGGAAVECIEAEGLRLVVSDVGGGDFTPAAFVDHLDDLEWVSANAEAHVAVLGAALATGPVLPLRFGTVFADRRSAADVLRRHADDLHAEVDRLTGRCEWGAKALVDLDACERWIAEHAPGPTDATDATGATGATAEPVGTPGRAYLTRRRAQRATRDERRRLLLEIAGEVHDRLSALAVDARTDPPQERQLSGHRGEMILNGAYLVDDDAAERLREAAAELTARHADQGVAVTITGPWPPHHFVALPPLGDPGDG